MLLVNGPPHPPLSPRSRRAPLAIASVAIAWVALGIGASLAHAQGSAPDCFPPGAPEIPDGNTASYPDMVRVQQLMKLYRESALAYTECMKERIERLGTRVPTRRRERWVKQRQEVVDSIQTTTDRYNASVRAFKQKSEGAAANPESTPSQPPPAQRDSGGR
jgi:hypothetical protein